MRPLTPQTGGTGAQEKLGAQRIVQLGLSDHQAPDGLDGAWQEWKPLIYSVIEVRGARWAGRRRQEPARACVRDAGLRADHAQTQPAPAGAPVPTHLVNVVPAQVRASGCAAGLAQCGTPSIPNRAVSFADCRAKVDRRRVRVPASGRQEAASQSGAACRGERTILTGGAARGRTRRRSS